VVEEEEEVGVGDDDVVDISLEEELGDMGMPRPGMLLGGTYRIRRILGRGGMGIVYLAEDEHLQRDVAVKVIAGEVIKRPESHERFLLEARSMAGVEHENVVRIYSFGRYEDRPYFVMEYVPGNNLAGWLERWDDESLPPPSVDEVLGILDQITRGLKEIHRAGIVHADVKPGNVLIGPAFRVAVTDFGLVRRLGETDESELIVGTPSYIAPEVVYNEQPTFDPRADVYSLGVVAYEMFTGTLPFPIETVGELFDVHMKRLPPVPPSDVRGDLPEAFDEVLLRALSRELDERYPTAEAFRKALFAARESVSVAPSNLRLILADDDEDFRDLAEETLRFAFPGAWVECYDNGDDALAALDRRPASLAVIDLDMPGLNGVELTAAIRGQDQNAKMPIVVVTAHGGATDWRLLQALGADGFLVKPLDPYALIAMARRALGGSIAPPRRF